MPKKFRGENSKAVEAKARVEEKKTAERIRIDKEKEDLLWVDDDKQTAKKLERKELQEKKRLEQLNRKNENKKLLEDEMAQIKGVNLVKSTKITQKELDSYKESQLANLSSKLEQSKSLNITQPIDLEENMNKLLNGEGQARNVEQALAILSVEDVKLDEHPERRMKASYATFEAENLPRLKAENANMRLSQLKQLLKKEWLKSPQNPMNQHHANKVLIEQQHNKDIGS